MAGPHNQQPQPASSTGHRRITHLLGKLAIILTALQVGIALLAFPWSRYWAENYFADLSPGWRAAWLNPYFRGAVSGLGLANLYLCLLELFRLERWLRPAASPAATTANSAKMKVCNRTGENP